METFQIITAIAGAAMSLGYYPQAYKIWKLKSSREISLAQYTIFGLGTTIWFVYGLLVNDLVIMAGFGIGVIGSWLVLLLSLRYRK